MQELADFIRKNYNLNFWGDSVGSDSYRIAFFTLFGRDWKILLSYEWQLRLSFTLESAYVAWFFPRQREHFSKIVGNAPAKKPVFPQWQGYIINRDLLPEKKDHLNAPFSLLIEDEYTPVQISGKSSPEDVRYHHQVSWKFRKGNCYRYDQNFHDRKPDQGDHPDAENEKRDRPAEIEEQLQAVPE